MKETMNNLKLERDKITDRLTKIDKAIKSFQNVCTHKNNKGESTMIYEGHDSHKNYYKCSICEFEDWG